MAITFNTKRQASLNIGTVTQAPNYYYVLASGPTFTTRSLTGATDIFTDTAVAGDYMLFGIRDGHCKPAGFEFDVTTALVAAAVTVVWEYRKTDGTWAAFAGVTDNTVNFTVAGTNSVTWTMPTDWGTNATAVNGITGRMWCRARLSVATTLTEGGRTTNPLNLYDYAITVDGSADYANGTATAGSTSTITDSGKAWTTNELQNRIVYIHTGTNSGLARIIISNTATVITILDLYPVAIDTTSQYTIGLNFEDIYQADVSGGWGVVTKVGSHSYSFACFLRFGLAHFSDIQQNVEFVQDFLFYVGETHSNRYPMFLGWRLPTLYGLNRGIFGCSITSNRTCCCDNRGAGFSINDEYLFTAGNRFLLRHDYPPTGSDGFIRSWFNNYHRYSIDDRWEGWRSVTFPKTTNPRTEVRKPTVIFGHSGFETPYGSISEATAIYPASLGYFQTQSQNLTFPELDITFNNFVNSSRFGAPMQYFSSKGITNLDDYKGNRFRLMLDVFGSTPNTGITNWRNTIRATVTDEYGNLLPNARFDISDSLAQNRKTYLDFDGGVGNNDTLIASNDATGNQFSGSTAFSFEAWVFPRTIGGSSLGRVLEKGATGTVGYGLYISGNLWTAFVVTNTGTKTSNTITATYYSWHHIVVIWNGSQLQLYVDNVATSTSSATGTPADDSASSLYIGSSVTASRTFDGEIRRIRLFKNKALSAGDYASLWNNGNYVQNETCPVSGCTAEYNFTEGSGTTVADTSGNNVTATLGASTAAPVWRDTNSGRTSNAITAYTGTQDSFLVTTTVTVGNSYSLTSQPAAATRLRFVVTNFRDTSSSSAANANIDITGTDADGNTIEEAIYLEEIRNGVYFTKQEFLTVSASGIFITGFSGSISCDNLGILSPQKVICETWSTANDLDSIVADYNPITIRISRAGFEPVVIKKNIYERQDLVISMKRSSLDILSGLQSAG